MEVCVIGVSVHISIMDDVSKYFKSVISGFLNFPLDASIVGSVVEFSPATRETGVRFPDNVHFTPMFKKLIFDKRMKQMLYFIEI